MGEHAYAYKGHSNYGDYGRGGDQVRRTVIYDSDGRKRTVVGCSPYDTESYVVETEVTEQIVSPVITDYRYGSPKKVDPIRDYGSYRKPTSPYGHDRRPQEVDQFLTGVQVEASRPPAHRYSPSNGVVALRPTNHHSIGVPTGYGGSDHYKTKTNPTGRAYGGYSSDEDEYDREEAYYKPGHQTTRPEEHHKYNNGYGGGWAAPKSTHTAAPNSKLSMPTNRIDEAIDFLIGGGPKNTSSTTTTSEVMNPYGYNSNSKVVGGSEAVRPYGYSSNNPKSGSLETVKPYVAKSTNQTAPVIDCYEAARRYNGTVVRNGKVVRT